MVTWKNEQFYIDGKPFHIYGGSIHYFRSMPEKWYDLLLKLKNCGLNTVETYCSWNLHEPRPGEYDFSGRLDIERFIQTAADLGLYVIIRPGPYICAEWEFGGLPAWLLAEDGIRLRTDEGNYLTYTKRYFEHLMPHILPHLQTRGGNVILMAVENEYGSFGNSTKYMNACAELMRSYGIDIPLFTADGGRKMFLDGGHADGCLCSINFGYNQGTLPDEYVEVLKERQPGAPLLHAEFWIGMFGHWGEPHKSYKSELVASEVREHLEKGMDFIFYMFHGGTNFGFMNGANLVWDDSSGRPRDDIYRPGITSYDYDSLLTEWGEVTPKYLAVQKVMSEFLNITLPVPESVPVTNYGDVLLTKSAGLFDNLSKIGEHFTSSYPRNMEHYGQSYGYILYRTQVAPMDNLGVLKVNGVADMAYIFFNGVFRGTIHRNDEEACLVADGWLDEGGTLDILVENQGRVNFLWAMDQGERKGILNQVIICQNRGPCQILYNWEVYTLPMEHLERLDFSDAAANSPAFYRGQFRAEEKKDSFIHLEHFTKGFVVVNGFNLGRYWNIGPQLSLYLPAQLLQDDNEILVFDTYPVDNPVVSIRDYHILDYMRTEEVPLPVGWNVKE